MKGVVFTEFLELVEDRFGLEIADQIIANAALPTEGAFTSVGTYDHQQLIRLVIQLHESTGVPISSLVKVFGQHLLHRLAATFPEFFVNVHSVEELLPTVSDVIHVEVRKLYPEAELPTLTFTSKLPGQFSLEYLSTRPFADLAEGLLRGAAEYFGEEIEFEREDLAGDPGTAARFHVTSLRKAEKCLTSMC